MAELKKDNNYVSVSGGVTDDASQTVQPLRVDATTYYLMTSPSIDSEASGSIAVNMVAGTVTTTVGSVQIADGTITSGTVRIASGTVNIGNTPSVVVNSGTITTLSEGTVNLGLGSSVTISSGTLFSGGTCNVQTLSGGTVNIGNELVISSGTINTAITSVTISGGTIDVLSSGTVNTTVTVGSLIMSDGTLTSGTVRVSGGSIQLMGTSNINTVSTVTSITGGTINAQGTVNVNTVSTVSSISGGTINAQGTINVATLGTISTGTINIDTITNLMSISSGTLLASGTCNVQTVSGGSIWALGNIAHDSADSGNPVKVGAKATTALSGITAVVNNDRTDLYAGVDGVLITRLNSGLEDVVRGQGTIMASGLGTVEIIAAGGAGVKVYLTDVTIGNSSGTFLFVNMCDGATKKWTFPVPSLGGVTSHFTTPLAGTANTYWMAEATGSASSLSINASGFKSKV
jgi:hypothetical protein